MRLAGLRAGRRGHVPVRARKLHGPVHGALDGYKPADDFDMSFRSKPKTVIHRVKQGRTRCGIATPDLTTGHTYVIVGEYDENKATCKKCQAVR